MKTENKVIQALRDKVITQIICIIKGKIFITTLKYKLPF